MKAVLWLAFGWAVWSALLVAREGVRHWWRRRGSRAARPCHGGFLGGKGMSGSVEMEGAQGCSGLARGPLAAAPACLPLGEDEPLWPWQTGAITRGEISAKDGASTTISSGSGVAVDGPAAVGGAPVDCGTMVGDVAPKVGTAGVAGPRGSVARRGQDGKVSSVLPALADQRSDAGHGRDARATLVRRFSDGFWGGQKGKL